jgi:hypothetical protein
MLGGVPQGRGRGTDDEQRDDYRDRERTPAQDQQHDASGSRCRALAGRGVL